MGKRSRWIAAAVGVVLAAALGLGVVRYVRQRAIPEPPPTPALRVSEEGVTTAVLDGEALTAWCRRQGLPDPPGLTSMDPEVADALLGALGRAAETGSPADLGRVGMIAESFDSHAAAEAYFRRAAELAPQDFRWVYYRGCVAQETGRSDAAIEHLERARALGPLYPLTYARLGQLYLDAGRLDEAAAMFARYTKDRPEDWLGPVGSGRVALARNDPGEALRFLEEAARINADDFQVQHHLGRIHAALGDRERAAGHFARAQELPQGGWWRFRDPMAQEMYELTSSVANLVTEFERLSGTDDWAALARLGEEIVRRRAADATMLGNLAALYRKMGRFTDAHGALDRALRVGGNEVRVHDLRAEVHLAEGGYESAIAATDRALALAPDDARAHGVRARALIMLERAPEAEVSMRRSLELAPGDAGNWFLLGEIARVQDRRAEAVAAYRRTLEIDPENALARERLEAIEGGG